MIKNIKTIFIKNLMDFKSSYTVDINLDFNPHEMIVKKIDFYSAEEEGAMMFFIRSDIVNDYIGYTRNSHVNISNELQTRFQIKNQIRGTYKFTTFSVDNREVWVAGVLVICLEFIEYEK